MPALVIIIGSAFISCSVKYSCRTDRLCREYQNCNRHLIDITLGIVFFQLSEVDFLLVAVTVVLYGNVCLYYFYFFSLTSHVTSSLLQKVTSRLIMS